MKIPPPPEESGLDKIGVKYDRDYMLESDKEF